MKISIDKKLKTSVYLQIVDEIKRQIISGELPENYGMMSERQLAKEIGVHRNTVTRAYKELEADGLLKAIHGVGYRVAVKEEDTGKRIKKVNWENMIKDEYVDRGAIFDELFYKSYTDDSISFAGGMAATNIYHKDEIAERFHEIIEEEANTEYFYTSYQGEDELLDLIVKQLRKKGIFATRGEIQLLSETNQAIDFLVSLFIKPGDGVILEEPVSPDIYRAIDFAGAKAITMPMDEEGMICTNLGGIIEKYNPKFIYVNSSYHDPTTRLMSTERKKQLLNISYKYRIPIIEEDAASELYYNQKPSPSLKALDRGNNVIYIYSFSLSFIPGMNVAFVVAPKETVCALSYLVSVRLVSLDWLPQRLLYKYIKDGSYDKRLEEFRQEYKIKRDIMCSWLDRVENVEYKKPEGGVYVWCKLPKYLQADKLLERCRTQGVSFMPGNLFYPHKNGGHNYIRLDYSYPSKDKVEKGMKILTECIENMSKKSGT